MSELPASNLLNTSDMPSSGSRGNATTIKKNLDANIAFQRTKCSLEERVTLPGAEAWNPTTVKAKGLVY